MTSPELLRLFEQTLGIKPDTLTGTERLRDLEIWDSMSNLLFIAMVDKHFSVPVPASRVARCETVDELLGLIPVARAAA
ncbi:MAG: acyl carrier protein [Planctomycetes bacterium]|nr:acyl carrier protein [Planctomycetota bacterium]